MNHKDPSGAMALHYAAVAKAFDLTKDIMGMFKLDLNEKDNLRLTPLMYFILSGNQIIHELRKTDNDVSCVRMRIDAIHCRLSIWSY